MQSTKWSQHKRAFPRSSFITYCNYSHLLYISCCFYCCCYLPTAVVFLKFKWHFIWNCVRLRVSDCHSRFNIYSRGGSQSNAFASSLYLINCGRKLFWKEWFVEWDGNSIGTIEYCDNFDSNWNEFFVFLTYTLISFSTLIHTTPPPSAWHTQ